MFSTDQFLDRTRTKDYNCFDFVREVWLSMTGEDIGSKLQKLVGDHANLKVTASGMKGFRRIVKPHSPCFVVMQRMNTVPHCALFIDGRIFHLKESGVEFRELSLAKWSYTNLKFYKSL